MATKKKVEADEIVEASVEVEPRVNAPVDKDMVEPERGVGVPDVIHSIVARDGDSYASIAVRLAPEGVRARDFARELLALNGGAPVRPGMMVKVK